MNNPYEGYDGPSGYAGNGGFGGSSSPNMGPHQSGYGAQGGVPPYAGQSGPYQPGPYGGGDYSGSYGNQFSGSGPYQQGPWPQHPPVMMGVPQAEPGFIIGQSFKAFGDAAAEWIVGVLAHLGILTAVYFAVNFAVMAVSFIGAIVMGSVSSTAASEPLNFLGVVALLLTFGAIFGCVFACMLWMQANFCYAANKAMDGEKLTFGDFFQFKSVAGLMKVFLCVGLIVTVGFVLIIPGIIAMVLFWAAPVIKAKEPSLSVGQCLSLSQQMVRQNFGTSLGIVVLLGLIQFAFSLMPLVGLIPAFPITALGYAIAARAFSQQQCRLWP